MGQGCSCCDGGVETEAKKEGVVCELPDFVLHRIEDIVERCWHKRPFDEAIVHVARALARVGMPYTSQRLIDDLVHDKRIVQTVVVPEAGPAPPIYESTASMILATIEEAFRECGKTPPPGAGLSPTGSHHLHLRRRSSAAINNNNNNTSSNTNTARTEPLDDDEGGDADDEEDEDGTHVDDDPNHPMHHMPEAQAVDDDDYDGQLPPSLAPDAAGESPVPTSTGNITPTKRGDASSPSAPVPAGSGVSGVGVAAMQQQHQPRKSVLEMAAERVKGASSAAVRRKKAERAVWEACESALHHRLKTLLDSRSRELLQSRIAGIAEIGAPATKRNAALVGNVGGGGNLRTLGGSGKGRRAAAAAASRAARGRTPTTATPTAFGVLRAYHTPLNVGVLGSPADASAMAAASPTVRGSAATVPAAAPAASRPLQRQPPTPTAPANKGSQFMEAPTPISLSETRTPNSAGSDDGMLLNASAVFDSLPAADFVLDPDSGMLWSASLRLYFEKASGRFWSPDKKVWMDAEGSVLSKPTREEIEGGGGDSSDRKLMMQQRKEGSSDLDGTERAHQQHAIDSIISPARPANDAGDAAAGSLGSNATAKPNNGGDPLDPSTHGLSGHWQYIARERMFWSATEKLYYDPETQRYGEPTTNKWSKPGTSEWA